jgi:hypothetical protein
MDRLPLLGGGAKAMNFFKTNDQSLLAYYENIRRQVDADRSVKIPVMGQSVREYAERLREEMNRRRFRFNPIDWPR